MRAAGEAVWGGLEAAAAGGEFAVPAAEQCEAPGPCAAVMITLAQRGPLRTSALFDAIEERWPGTVRSRTHLKQRILKRALVNKLMKVRDDGGKFKDCWAPRKGGQVRGGSARGATKSTGTRSIKSPRGGKRWSPASKRRAKR